MTTSTLGGDLRHVAELERIQLKATTVDAGPVPDQGLWVGVISSAAVDREGDIVSPAGMVHALRKWIPTGKNIPLLWSHGSRPEDCIGYVSPSSVRVAGDEVIASGWIDRDTPAGAHAWRCVRSGTGIGFSFGYLTVKSTPREGGGRAIEALDVYEISCTNAPAQAATRVLSFKQTAAARLLKYLPEPELPLRELKRQMHETEFEWAAGGFKTLSRQDATADVQRIEWDAQVEHEKRAMLSALDDHAD